MRGIYEFFEKSSKTLIPLKNDLSSIDGICNEIKKIGRLPVNPDNLSEKMEIVLHYMRDFDDNLNVQWAACHAISNVSMDINFATDLMEMNSHLLILKAVQVFGKNDWKICWLGCSAIWNLARPPSHRMKFDGKCLETMLGVLFQYTYVPKVVNTAMGAISNLCLQPIHKHTVSTYVEAILPIMNQYADESHICATAGGLLANLAVSDDVADILVQKGALLTISRMWEMNNCDENFQRNTVAVLSNCLTSSEFVSEIIQHELIEKLFRIHSTSTNVSVTTLIGNCFQALQIDPECNTTSLHMACHHGKYMILKKKVFSCEDVESIINLKDGRNAPMLLYAAASNHLHIVKFLIKCGADFEYLLREDIADDLEQTIQSAYEENEMVRSLFQDAIYCHTKTQRLPEVLSHVVADYLPSYGMFKSIRAF